MKSWIWLRVLCGVFVFFLAGHTVGVLTPPRAESPAAAVYTTMASVRFPAMGFERSYGEFYRGFGLFVTLGFAVLAAFSWQVSAVSRRDARTAMPMAVTLLAASAGSAILSGIYFFAAPMLMSAVAVLCAAVVVGLLARERRIGAAGA